jgi:UDP-N-acetylmuramoyl-tripeptide--D-alanyl-D-alanine ligase
MRPALEKGIAFFDRKPGYPVYPGQGDEAKAGGMGEAALVTLAIVDYVRGLPADAAAEHDRWADRAKSYVDFLVRSREPDGLWFGKYRYDDGTPFGAHSSYSDGEALLALVEAMKYLGRSDLEATVKGAAEAGHRVNVVEALAKERDSDVTKGYYQWSSMAFYELATSDAGKGGPYGDWLLALADWILDVHHVLDKPKNTGYAFEGLVSAYAWAKANGDARTAKLECAIHRGLSSLMSWQVGHPRATGLGTSDDPKAIGGVQNGKSDPGLRIDVTQHQMHATMFALRHLFP